MTQENQPIRPKEILLGLSKGGECFFPKDKEDSAKSVASNLKRKSFNIDLLVVASGARLRMPFFSSSPKGSNLK